MKPLLLVFLFVNSVLVEGGNSVAANSQASIAASDQASIAQASLGEVDHTMLKNMIQRLPPEVRLSIVLCLVDPVDMILEGYHVPSLKQASHAFECAVQLIFETPLRPETLESVLLGDGKTRFLDALALNEAELAARLFNELRDGQDDCEHIICSYFAFEAVISNVARKAACQCAREAADRKAGWAAGNAVEGVFGYCPVEDLLTYGTRKYGETFRLGQRRNSARFSFATSAILLCIWGYGCIAQWGANEISEFSLCAIASVYFVASMIHDIYRYIAATRDLQRSDFYHACGNACDAAKVTTHKVTCEALGLLVKNDLRVLVAKTHLSDPQGIARFSALSAKVRAHKWLAENQRDYLESAYNAAAEILRKSPWLGDMDPSSIIKKNARRLNDSPAYGKVLARLFSEKGWLLEP